MLSATTTVTTGILNRRAPRVSFLEHYRPRRFEEVAGNRGAISLLRGIILAGGMHLLLYGERGCGKSTLARLVVRSLLCEARVPPDINPCGACTGCQFSEERSALRGCMLIERNAVELTRSMVTADFDYANYSFELLTIHYDEIAYASKEVQALLLTKLEQHHNRFLFIASGAEVDRIEPALLQRLQSVEVRPPSLEELIPCLRTIAVQEGCVQIEDEVLASICELNDCVPRRCVQALAMLLAQTLVLTIAEVERLRNL